MHELSREELTEWMAFWELEPFGSHFEEYGAALVASVVAEVNRNRKKRGRAFTPKDFMVEWGKDKEARADPKTMFAFIQNVQAQLETRYGKTPGEMDQPVLLDAYGKPVVRG